MLAFERTINLSTNLNNTFVTDYAPLSLTIDPGYLIVSKKIYKINYIFEDETITKNLYYSNEVDESLPIQTEVGDPRNYKINKKLHLSKSDIQQRKKIIVEIYQIGVSTPTIIILYVDLIAPTLDGSNNGFFDNVNLLYSRMFGVNNDILYVFESKNPNYYIPIVVNWNNRIIPKKIVQFIKNNSRAYDVLQPFQKSSDQNSEAENPYNIDFVNVQDQVNKDPNYPKC